MENCHSTSLPRSFFAESPQWGVMRQRLGSGTGEKGQANDDWNSQTWPDVHFLGTHSVRGKGVITSAPED